MNSAAPTKIFGVRMGLDPKVIVVVLIGVAAILFWYNSRGDEGGNPSSAGRPSVTMTPPTVAGRSPATGTAAARRPSKNNDHGTLRLRAIDPTRGDVDPTLHLDFLARLQSITPSGSSRNLFQMGAAPLADGAGKPIPHPIIAPKPLPPPVSRTPPLADINIPLKYYGFAKPIGKGENNRAFFLDGDNILIASEGDVLKQKYLVVELTATSARLEDTEVKKGKTLPLVPEARDMSNPGPNPGLNAGVNPAVNPGANAGVDEQGTEQQPMEPQDPGVDPQ
ncbi:MAG: hypothetical protein ACJ74Z_05860 [Bryobacteraceae bacterium]